MKSRYFSICLLCSLIAVSGCKKEKNPPTLEEVIAGLSSSLEQQEDSTIKSYLLISINEHLGAPSDNIDINVLGRLQSEEGQKFTIGDITIDNAVTISPVDTMYQHEYDQSELVQGVTMAGRLVNIDWNAGGVLEPGSGGINVPPLLSVNLGSTILSSHVNKTINWSPDPWNQYKKIGIEVVYEPAMTRMNNSSLPSAIANLVYIVDDIGSFTIPATDLQRFPEGAIVRLHLVRASGVVSHTNPSFEYLATTSATSPPLMIQ